MADRHDENPNWHILLYLPNIIGYLRLFLIIISMFTLWSRPLWFLFAYSLQAILDAVDGFLARKLRQSSAFGAWLDVVIDNVGRSLLWSYAAPTIGPIVACLEWLAFVCNHAKGPSWKSKYNDAPHWVQAVMRNGFRSPCGVLVLAGIHVLPLFIYGRINDLGIPIILANVA
eukprot:gene2023-5096_t